MINHKTFHLDILTSIYLYFSFDLSIFMRICTYYNTIIIFISEESCMNTSKRRMGLFYVITGATCWELGDSSKNFSRWSSWCRLACNDTLAYGRHFTLNAPIVKKESVSGYWGLKNKASAGQLLIFGLFGMLAVQYTYMASIQHGNAAVATLLQYLSPVIVIIYSVLRKELFWPNKIT